jgi:hypothetical protein
MKPDSLWLLALFSLVCLAALLAGCGASPAPPGAGAEATAIIQQAQATAAALRAQAAAPAAPTSPPLPAAPTPTPAAAQPAPASLAAEEPVSGTIEVTGAGYAADGAYIIVRFKAPPQVARRWMQGTVSVTDEATGQIYGEIPTMPLIGPLIGHPAQAGQPGYVMLVNTPPGLPPGSLVTVLLGDFKQEHVHVQQ